MLTIEQMVQREINCCVSSLVSTLADAYTGNGSSSIENLAEQAQELTAPVLDYEEAARQAGFIQQLPRHSADLTWIRPISHDDEQNEFESAQEACDHDGINPYEWEVYEHWAVSEWLAEKLIEQGERVDTDFAGLNVWARTTTGQAISMDGCIQKIYTGMMAPETFPSVAPGA